MIGPRDLLHLPLIIRVDPLVDVGVGPQVQVEVVVVEGPEEGAQGAVDAAAVFGGGAAQERVVRGGEEPWEVQGRGRDEGLGEEMQVLLGLGGGGRVVDLAVGVPSD
jgi:hypothetical protein